MLFIKLQLASAALTPYLASKSQASCMSSFGLPLQQPSFTKRIKETKQRKGFDCSKHKVKLLLNSLDKNYD